MKIFFIIILQIFSFTCFGDAKLDVNKYVKASMEGLSIQTEVHKNTWGIGKSDTWDVDQKTGLIWWTFSDGKVATAPVQIIGTYNPKDSSFLWGWDHPSVLPPLQEHAKLVKHFGEKNDIKKFITKKLKITENEAWEFVAVANRLANANGGYRANAGGSLVFMTYGQITHQKKAP